MLKWNILFLNFVLFCATFISILRKLLIRYCFFTTVVVINVCAVISNEKKLLLSP